jgi:hypothetical protein
MKNELPLFVEEVFITIQNRIMQYIYSMQHKRFSAKHIHKKTCHTCCCGCNLGQDKNRRYALGNYRLGNSPRDILHDKNVDATLQGYPSMFQVPFTKQERVAHDDNDLEQTLQAFEISMRISSKSIKKGKGRYKR